MKLNDHFQDPVDEVRKPVLDRLEKLKTQFREFLEEEPARLLHWVIEHGERQLVDTFFEVENHEESDSTHLIVPLNLEFTDEHSYGLMIAKAIGEYYEILKPSFQEEGIACDWVPPAPVGGDPGGCTTALNCIASLHGGYSETFDRAVLVLMPPPIVDGQGWTKWWGKMLAALDASDVRVVALDDVASPRLAKLARQRADVVRTKMPTLDVASMPLEISEAAGHLDEPFGAYRHANLETIKAVEEGDMETAEAKGGVALRVAAGEGWHACTFNSHFVLATGWLGARQIGRALEHYLEAERAGLRTELEGEDYGKTLRVYARMSIGSALILDNSFQAASEVYETSAPVAEESGDLLLSLECWRMAAYCRERNGDWNQAFENGMRGLVHGEQMDEQTRKGSTLPFLGEQLIKVCPKSKYTGQERELEQKFRTLCGDDWRELTQVTAPPNDPSKLEAMTIQPGKAPS